jgi:hypothetical protein
VIPRIKPLLAIALWLCAPLALAQDKLGELLDAGARKLSAEEFRQELVQRVIVGPTMSGGTLEVLYANSGEIQGRGIAVASTSFTPTPVSGEWRIGDTGKICSSMQLGGTNTVILPSRCQSWFKLADQYFLSDSDSDRQARVLRRTIKQ